jgi:hypothetical protein
MAPLKVVIMPILIGPPATAELAGAGAAVELAGAKGVVDLAALEQPIKISVRTRMTDKKTTVKPVSLPIFPPLKISFLSSLCYPVLNTIFDQVLVIRRFLLYHTCQIKYM